MALPAVFAGMAAAGIGAVLVRFAKWLVLSLGLAGITLVALASIQTWFESYLSARMAAFPALITQMLLLCKVPYAASMIMSAHLVAIKANAGRKIVFRKGGSS